MNSVKQMEVIGELPKGKIFVGLYQSFFFSVAYKSSFILCTSMKNIFHEFAWKNTEFICKMK